MINLRVFSNFSIGESILKPYQIVDLALKNNQKIVAMIDRMNMFGVLEFSMAAIKKKIKPIIGCILKIYNYGYINVYIKNQEGYINISTILTEFYRDKKEYINIEDLVKISNINENIIITWGGEEAYFLNEEDANLKASFLKEIFKENFYLEIQDNPNKVLILNVALSLNIPIVYTHNAYFENGNFEAYYTFDCIMNGRKYIQDEINNHSRKKSYFYSSEEIKIYGIYQEAIENTESIGKRCNFILEPKAPMIPEYVKDNPDKVLYDLVLEKLSIRLKKIPKEKHYIYYERIKKELDVLTAKGFSNYFLITHDFINRARELKIPVGPGRGSGTGSLVAYSLTITNVDPIAFGLIFERFLNPERVSLPDIDIDYCQERRDLIIKYLIEKYGIDNIAHIVTFGTLKSRIVVRDVGRALGVPLKIVDGICKFIPQDQVNPITLKEAVEIDKKLMEMFKQSPQTEKLLKISIQLEGAVRHLSTHAAGVVIYQNLHDNSKISKHLPLFRVEGEEILCTQASMKYVELSGLVKFDFLGLQTLTLIRKTCELIEKNHGIIINIEEVLHNDKKTFDFICTLNLAGVFQLDSFGMKSVIHDLQPDCLEDIIAIISLYRPGPMKFIPLYISNKKGLTKITYLIPELEPILKNTYGIIVYQEQVLEIAVKIAGYSLGEADSLRRAMGKKDLKEMAFQESKFLSGAENKNIKSSIAKELFNRMSDFAGYGFNKSHAAPYALISYWTAYLKTHYPLEFISSIMNLDKNDTNKLLIYLNDMHNIGIKLLPPCVEKSEAEFSIDKFQKNSIRFGLSAIKNMGEAFSINIINERNLNGVYKTIDDFFHRNISCLNKRQVEFLIYSGGLNILEPNKGLLIENLLSLIKGETIIDKSFSLKEDPFWEMEALGFFLTKHPMDNENFHKLRINTITEVMNLPNEKGLIRMGGVIYDIIKKKTHHNNKTYMFIKLLDTSGMYEITLFNETLDKYLPIIIEKASIVIEGNFEKKQNIIKIVANKIIPFEDYKKHFIKTIRLYLKGFQFEILKNILNKYIDYQEGIYKVLIIYKTHEYLLNNLININDNFLEELRINHIKYVFI